MSNRLSYASYCELLNIACNCSIAMHDRLAKYGRNITPENYEKQKDLEDRFIQLDKAINWLQLHVLDICESIPPELM